jgi:translation initiation factor 1
MADNDWKARLGMVYSTNPDFDYQREQRVETPTSNPEKQNLRVSLDRRKRAGKQVTLIAGFVGSSDDLETLAKTLKTKLGVGGAAKDGEIIIQGDWRDRAVALLISLGYVKSKKI